MTGNSAISYDANGNTYSAYQGRTYDVENRLNGESSGIWYDPSGKRVAQIDSGAGTWTLHFYDIFGQRIFTQTYPPGSGTYSLYLGNRLLQSDGVPVVTDRFGECASERCNQRPAAFSPALRRGTDCNGR